MENYDESLIMLNSSKYEEPNLSCGNTQILRKRKRDGKDNTSVNILNVVDKGKMDANLPEFAAAALALHVPFRSCEDLLRGQTLTLRLETLMKDSSNKALNQYVRNCQELSESMMPTENEQNKSVGDPEEPLSGRESSPFPECIPENQAEDITSCAAHLGDNNTLPAEVYKVTKPWSFHNRLSPHTTLQDEEYRSYIKKCRVQGVLSANKQLIEEGKETNKEKSKNKTFDPYPIIRKKNYFFENAKTEDQKKWLRSVLSYVQVYYCLLYTSDAADD